MPVICLQYCVTTIYHQRLLLLLLISIIIASFSFSPLLRVRQKTEKNEINSKEKNKIDFIVFVAFLSFFLPAGVAGRSVGGKELTQLPLVTKTSSMARSPWKPEPLIPSNVT